jgi:hypothetical protein
MGQGTNTNCLVKYVRPIWFLLLAHKRRGFSVSNLFLTCFHYMQASPDGGSLVNDLQVRLGKSENLNQLTRQEVKVTPMKRNGMRKPMLKILTAVK